MKETWERVVAECSGGRAQRVRLEGIVTAGAGGAAAELDAAGVQGDDREPMAEGAVGGEAVEESVDVGEDLLDDVLGLAVVAENARGPSAQAGAVASHEEVEAARCVRATRLQSAHEVGIGIRAAGGRRGGHSIDLPEVVREVRFRDLGEGARFFRGRGQGSGGAARGGASGSPDSSDWRWRSARPTRSGSC